MMLFFRFAPIFTEFTKLTKNVFATSDLHSRNKMSISSVEIDEYMLDFSEMGWYFGICVVFE